jgi:GT2 family glycosyltransferase
MALALTASPLVLGPRVRARPRKQTRAISETPRLSVVIVNYRQWESTAGLVRQIRSAPAARRGAVEVVVVDNHSPAHPLLGRLRRWTGVSLRRWGANRGFARAVNEGCRLSRGQWFLLLNPDVSVTQEFVEGALAIADRLSTQEPRTGIVGFKLHNADGSRQLSFGPFPTLWGTLAGLLWPRWRRKYHHIDPSERCRVPWLTGCCLLVRRDCWLDLGGLDRDFFLYYEDVDLCRRASARGWSVWYEPGLSVIHRQPLHGRAVSPAMRMITRHALLTYARRHWPVWQCRLMAGVVGLEACLQRWAARYRGDRASADCFGEIGALAADMAAGRPAAGRRRLLRVIRQAEGQNAP